MPTDIDMGGTSAVNGATATNGLNGHATALTPSHPAFDSIPDVIQAFGAPLHPSTLLSDST